jgi:acyl-CoA synthetase (AMP-forming)/AMP-acid ligase II
MTSLSIIVLVSLLAGREQEEERSCYAMLLIISPPMCGINREGNHPEDFTRFTYRKLLEEVCRFANVLKMHGVNKGDRVAIYMPMIMETPIAMLACARIGAVHSIVVS